MDLTLGLQESQSSGVDLSIEASFRASRRLFESTPKIETQSTSKTTLNPRKRKCFSAQKKLNNVVESCPSTPQFSSTLNDSFLMTKFNEFNLQENYYCPDDEEHLAKHSKIERDFLISATSESLVVPIQATPKKASFANIVTASPFKEKNELLYPTIVLKTPVKKPFTPEKYEKKEKLLKCFSFKRRKPNPLEEVFSNVVIMEEVFRHLSNGDIFRFSMVDKRCREAVAMSSRAKKRHLDYTSIYKVNKENYSITPPSSPEQDSLISGSPNNRNFRSFTQLTTKLNHNQTLTKCPRCNQPSIVENSVAQCQKTNCGYIYCQKCSSFSFSAMDFFDKCQSSDLIITPVSEKKPRKGLLDFSNNSLSDFTLSPLMHSSVYQSSGYESYNITTSPISVKRNLSKTFSTNDQPTKALFEINRSVKICHTKEKNNKSRSSIVSVVPKACVKEIRSIVEPSSPPRVKPYSACSKQSKKNLRRLTK